MRRALDDGLSAAEAARVALASELPSGNDLIDDARKRLMDAIQAFDEAGAQVALDDALAAFGLELFVRDLILPTLTAIGSGWEAGGIEVSQEHFASHLIRGRLLSLARLWGRGSGPLALLACAPGEQHDITLIAFGLILRSHGWRILYLGADTPLATLRATVKMMAPAVAVLVAFDPGLLAPIATEVRRLARSVPVFLGGPGAEADLAAALRLPRLDGDLIEAARQVARAPGGIS